MRRSWSSLRPRRRPWRAAPSLRKRCRCDGAPRGVVPAVPWARTSCRAAAITRGPCLHALQACCDEVLKVARRRLAAGMGDQALALAKAVPLVATLGSDLLSPALRPQLARLEAVRALSARVYGCCYCAAAP